MVVPVYGAAAHMKWNMAALSDRGKRRTRNEDAHVALPASRIYAVADGMGGHAAGDVASSMAIDVLRTAFSRAPSPRIRAAALSRRLIDVFATANRAILGHSATHRECAGMGTTLTVLAPLPASDQCVIAHVGDSRAYRFRGSELVQLTRDHTWVQQQVDAGILTAAQARNHPLSSVLSRVLGTPEMGPADTIVADVLPADVFLLCSDGLTTMLDDSEVRAILRAGMPPEACVRELVDTANRRGGMDNITVVLLTVSAA
jgi:serine/threonine protein phosphatase PrpC